MAGAANAWIAGAVKSSWTWSVLFFTNRLSSRQQPDSSCAVLSMPQRGHFLLWDWVNPQFTILPMQ